MERKIILKIVNKICRVFSDQQQPPQAQKPITPAIQLIISYNSNHAPLLNTKYNPKQQTAKKWKNSYIDQHPHFLLNSKFLSTKDDIRNNYVRIDKASMTITLISNLSKNNKELNTKINTCNSRHQQTQLIINNTSLPHIPIKRTTIQHNPNINNNNHRTVSTMTWSTNLQNSAEGKKLITILNPVL